ncbi:MAG: hypothetical protein Q7T44_13735 [Parvibaculum sp.]|nr:hypothetical protein [Parvibaculum sp.]
MVPKAASKILLGAVALLGLINLMRGSIHFFAPDGGLTNIAGLDISQNRDVILFFIGAVGAGQITMGLIELYAVWRYRDYVFPLLILHLVGSVLSLFLFFVWRPLPVVPPGQYGAVVSFVFFGLIAAREIYLRAKHDGA